MYYKFGKKISEGYLKVRIETPGDGRNSFSFCADIYSSYLFMQNGMESHSSGQCTEAIAEGYPDIGKWHEKLHLCDSMGTPMHAVANAWYRFSGADTGTYSGEYAKLSNRERAARDLSVTPEELPDPDTWLADYDLTTDTGKDAARAEFTLYCNRFRDQWRQNVIEFMAYCEANAELLSTFEVPEQTGNAEAIEAVADAMLAKTRAKAGNSSRHDDIDTAMHDCHHLVTENADSGLDDIVALLQDLSNDSERWDNMGLPRDMTLEDAEEYIDQAVSEIGDMQSFADMKNWAGYMYGREIYQKAVQDMCQALNKIEVEA